MCLAQGHNAVMLVSLKPAAPQSRVKQSTTEPLRSLRKFGTTLIFLGRQQFNSYFQNPSENSEFCVLSWCCNVFDSFFASFLILQT